MTLFDLMKSWQVKVMTDAKVEVLLIIESVTPNNHSENLEESNVGNDWYPKTRDWTTYTVKFTNGFIKEYLSIEEIELLAPMSTQDKIASIIESQFSGYRGRHPMLQGLKTLHKKMREVEGDEKFLEFLEKSVKENPRPVYKSPYIP